MTVYRTPGFPVIPLISLFCPRTPFPHAPAHLGLSDVFFHHELGLCGLGRTLEVSPPHDIIPENTDLIQVRLTWTSWLRWGLPDVCPPAE